ncbi:Lrp/AsnC family transcriptional regulator [Pseudosulfitobacter sp. DSM 107133]|jgi:Lrp/AsnC family leucine-responsive transcriptional regulator/Lrp/AsnC family transcriptional regulator|uniref:Lrp/AsnC family transcriptional regulator n=1 Tax=Pseudosulfitobacter sp. DSM 107133 TaxID=2883100 RepID=UPI000DF1D9F9|nr:Lrp/AsnC family transcriptional regulator [Pseudosulfitobacter sp. DSM 107133]UOA29220.1 Leucine-responsive regulatory protein [Pseudosulfitobacter sp. DSM 107133]
MHELDETDLAILRTMQSDGSLSVTEIAERVGLSQSPCSRRITQMQKTGVLQGRRVMLDAKKLGFQTFVIVRIRLHSHEKKTLDAFRTAVRGIPEIQTALLILGDFDFYLRVVVRDIEHYQHLMQSKLVALPGVREMQSSVIVEVVKDTSALPI